MDILKRTGTSDSTLKETCKPATVVEFQASSFGSRFVVYLVMFLEMESDSNDSVVILMKLKSMEYHTAYP